MTGGANGETSAFAIHPRLEADTVFVTDWFLSRVLLMNDARYPWLILVPRLNGLTELHDLDCKYQQSLMDEIACAGRILKALTGATKINIAALGNMVPQLHIHVVARKTSDAAWPLPIWGQGAAIAYETKALEEFLIPLRAALEAAY